MINPGLFVHDGYLFVFKQVLNSERRVQNNITYNIGSGNSAVIVPEMRMC
jgi:hypothetical protein